MHRNYDVIPEMSEQRTQVRPKFSKPMSLFYALPMLLIESPGCILSTFGDWFRADKSKDGL